MKSKQRRILSMFLSIVMLMSSTVALAAYNTEFNFTNKNVLKEGTDITNIPTISTVYIPADEETGEMQTDTVEYTYTNEKGEEATGTKKVVVEGTVPTTGLNAGDEFYIGLKMSNFDRFTYMDQGLRSMTVALVYNADYILPIEGNDEYAPTDDTDEYIKPIQARLKTITDSYLNMKLDKTAVYSVEANVHTYTSKTQIDDMGDDLSKLVGDAFTIAANEKKITDLAPYKLDTDYIAITKVRVKQKGPAEGLKVIGIAPTDKLNILLKGAESLGYNNEISELQKYLKLDTSKTDGILPIRLDVHHVGAEQKKDTDNNNINIAAQYKGTTLTKEQIEAAYDIKEYYNAEGTTSAAANGTITYKVSASSDITDPTDNTLKDLGTAWSATGTQTIYALVKYSDTDTKMCKVATITVNADGVKTITNVSGGTDSSAVEGGTISFRSTMTVTGTMNSGDSFSGVTIGNNGLKLYRKTSTTTWEEVTDNTKYNAGNNVFTVATGVPGTTGVVQLKTSANLTEFTVSAKTKATLSVPATTNKTYGENAAVTATATETTSGNALPTSAYQVLYKVSTAADSTYKTDVPTAAGTYTVKIQLTTTGNNAGTKTYSAAAATGTLVIAQKAIAVNVTIPTNVTYGAAEANRKATVASGTAGVTLATADYKVEYKGANDTAYSTTVPTNAGAYDVKVTLLNGNYSTTSTLTGKLNIAQKALNITGLALTEAQNPAATAAKTLTGSTKTFTSDKVGNDDVEITYSATISADKLKIAGPNKPVETNPAPSFTITGGTAKDNYSVGTISGVTVTVSDLDIATDLNKATKDDITAKTPTGLKASDTTKNTEAFLITNKAGLPTEGSVTVGSKTYNVDIVWAVDKAYTPTGTEYTYTATVTPKDASEVIVNLAAPVTVKVNVEAVSITKPSVTNISEQKGDGTIPLPAGGTTKAGDTDVAYTITWKDGTGNTVTTVDKSVVADNTYTGTITYTDAPTWATKPANADGSEDNGLTITVSVTAEPKTVVASVNAVTVAPIDANNEKNTEDDIASLLPATVTVVDDKGATHEVPVTWTKDADAPAYDQKGGEYTYTATLGETDKYDYAAITTPVKATITVNALTGTINKDSVFAPVTVAKGTTAADHEALGLVTAGTITVGGETVNYTVTWTTPVSDLDTTAAGNSKDFEGTIEFVTADVKPWMTLPTGNDLKVTQTVSVPADVKATGWKEAVAIDKTITAANANNTKEYLVDAIPTEFDTTAVAVDADGHEYTVTLTWALKDGTTHTPKAGVYEYTATPSSTEVDVTDLTAPTAKITVTEVKANFEPTIFDKVKVKKNAKVEKYEDMNFVTKANATLVPEVEGTTVEYTVGWTLPDGVTFDTLTKKTGNYNFVGKIDFRNAPEWLTLPKAEDLTGTKTVNVYSSGGGGGGSSTPSFAVVFSAGSHGKIVSGKSSLNIASGQVIKELPVVEANPGYKFVGWSQDGGKTIINLADNPIKNASTFTAVYEEDVKPTPTPTQAPAIHYNKPYASGYDGDVFLPENNITRAELATMIARLIYGDELPEGIYRASFSDIPSNAWYSKYVGYLESYGVLDGYDEDGIMVFKPEQTITRAEMATVITRMQKFAVNNADSMFWDVDNDYWAAGYISTLAAKDIITGYADGSFGPTNPLTRAEAVVIINRLLEPSEAVVTFMPVDISTHWAKDEIILAVNERQEIGTGEEATPEPEATPAPEATPEAEATAEPAA